MSQAAALASGKGRGEENFPVASRLIAPRHRPPILAFYDFARSADDVADHPTAPAARKLALLDAMEAGLSGRSDGEPAALALRRVLAERGLDDGHARDLLTAFRRDITCLRYPDWEALMDYCRYSAMPVGRFVLDVHGEDRAVWPASDALCAALQVINHLQDCGSDYRLLDRVYLPLDALQAAGVELSELGRPQGSAALRACIAGLARRADALLDRSEPLAGQVRDLRLAMEIAVIQRLARRLVRLLASRDPLGGKVRLRRIDMLALAAGGLLAQSARIVPSRRLVPAREAGPAAAAPSEDAAAAVSGSSFYAAMRLMKRPQRQAMFQIYAFCRAVDDVADDGPGDRAERQARLAQWRADIAGLYAGTVPPQLAGLADAIRAYGLQRRDFEAVIDGVAMDVAGDIRAPAWAELELYCDRVACAVGRLCVRVFGIEGPEGTALADRLGRALQLTNILRDLDEDAAAGRLYLPREALLAAGIADSEPAAVLADPRLPRACDQVCQVAEAHYRAAAAIMDGLPREAVRTPRIMAEAYHAVLQALQARGWSAPRRPVQLSRVRLVGILLRRAMLR